MATTKQPFVPPDRPLDGVRNGINGWRMSEAEAKERTIGNEEWWKMEGIDGRTVPLKQYSRKGPKERPIWMWSNAHMYLGEWKENLLRGILHAMVLELSTTTVQKSTRARSTVASGKTEGVAALARSFGSNQHQAGKTTDLMVQLLKRMVMVVPTCTAANILIIGKRTSPPLSP